MKRLIPITLVAVLVLPLPATRYADGQTSPDVMTNVKQGLIPLRVSEKGVTEWRWKPTAECSADELIEARTLFETRLHEDTNEPFGASANRIILRQLNHVIPPNEDKAKAFQIRTVCVFPRNVDVPWKDSEGNDHRYLVSQSELSEWRDHIERQMNVFSEKLFEASGGKLWLVYRVHQHGTLQKLRPGKSYALSVTPASAWVGNGFSEHEVLYIFFVPKIGGLTSHDRCPMAVATYSGKSKRFPHRYITVYTNTERLKKSDGWVRWDLGIPHELWHFIRDVLPTYCDYKGWLPNDDNLDHRKILKAECREQGLPVEYAHEDQYSTFITWKSVSALQNVYGMSIEKW